MGSSSPSPPRGPVVLVGFPATGKSTVGRALAGRLGWAFLDLDDLIAAGAGASVSEIFAREGEAVFRDREAAALRQALAGNARTVIATGGGAVCRPDNLQAILERGRAVALRASLHEALRRAGTMSGRPLLDVAADREGAARALFEARRSLYDRAPLRIETDGRSVGQIVDEIVTVLRLEEDHDNS